MLKKILPVLLLAAAPAAYAAPASDIPPGSLLHAEMCFGWRLSESQTWLCVDEMRNAASDADREAVARRYYPDYRLPPGAPDDGFGRPPRNPNFK